MILNIGKSQNSLFAEQKSVLQNNKYNINDNSLPFKGVSAATHGFFSLIQTHEIAGPVIVNTFSMVIPRTAIDFFTRSKETGIETGRRELTSLISSSLMPGLYALGTGGLLGMFYGVKGTLPVNNSIMAHLKSAWDATSNKDFGNKSIEEYVVNTLKGTKKIVQGKSKSFSKKEIEEVSKIIAEYIKERVDKKNPKYEFKTVTKKVVGILKTEQELNVGSVESSVGNLIRSSKEMMVNVFHKYKTPEKIEKAFEKLTNICKKRTFAGLAIAGAIALSTQYVNRYLTKRKTGSSAFVGLPNYDKIANQKKKKNIFDWKLIAEKTASVAIMACMLGATLSEKMNPKKIWNFFVSKPHKLAAKLQFKGNFPSLNQLRLLSAVTYSGRMLAASDRNELRETNIRDIFGYLNWLVFGGFVTKLVGHSISGGKLCVEKKPFEGGGWIKKQLHIIKNTYLMSRNEINANYPKLAKNLTWQRNFAIGKGILYSTVILGAAIPLFNKYVTNKVVSKEINKQNFNNSRALVKNTFGNANKDSLINKFGFSLTREQNKKIFYGDFLKLKQK